jgi:hypothetical protein
MTTTTKPETGLEPPAEDHGADGLGNFGAIHLVACLGAGGAVVLVINLIEWLR